MNMDSEYYKYQTFIRGVFSEDELVDICNKESKRLGAILRPYLNYLRQKSNPIALDAPCGYGNMLYIYRENNIPAEGVDLDESQISLAQKMGLNAKKIDIFDLSEKSTYSIISSLDFIEHLEKDRALGALIKFHKMLKDDGMLIIRTPCGDTPFGIRDFCADPTHKWFGTSECISSILKIAGFKKVVVLEDWPIPTRFMLIRTVLIEPLTRGLIRILLKMIGYGSPTCLSPSMILIATKS